MKLKFVLIFQLIFFVSCTVTEKPEFIKVDAIKIQHSTAKTITVVANAHFLNKNSVGGNLQLNEIHVLIDSMAVAKVNSETFKVPKKETFTIPLTVKIPYDKVFKKNKNNILGDVLNILTRKEILIQYKGTITYKLGKFSYDYSLDNSDKVKLNF